MNQSVLRISCMVANWTVVVSKGYSMEYSKLRPLWKGTWSMVHGSPRWVSAEPMLTEWVGVDGCSLGVSWVGTGRGLHEQCGWEQKGCRQGESV